MLNLFLGIVMITNQSYNHFVLFLFLLFLYSILFKTFHSFLTSLFQADMTNQINFYWGNSLTHTPLA